MTLWPPRSTHCPPTVEAKLARTAIDMDGPRVPAGNAATKVIGVVSLKMEGTGSVTEWR